MGFVHPAALWLGALYGVLILLHLWERRHHRFDVPSLLLWEAVPEERSQPARFRPDSLFWLQCLVLAGLIGALAMPFLPFAHEQLQAGRYVFVLDTSASMQAREADGSSRFERAREALIARIRALGSRDEATLLAASTRPRVMVPFTRDRTALERAAARLQADDGAGRADVALAVAAAAASRESRGATSIEFFTDVDPSALPTKLAEQAKIHRFGSSDENLAIEDLQVLQGRFQTPEEATVRVTIRNHARHTMHGLLRLRIDGRPLDSQGFSLTAGGAQSILVRGTKEPGVVHAHLDADDALLADNDAWGWLAPARPMRMVVVASPHPILNELRLMDRALPQFTLEFISPGEYSESGVSGADLVVFHQYVPLRLPPNPCLLLSPPANNALVRAVDGAAGAEVLDWNEMHPLLRGSAAALPATAAASVLLEPPPWAEPLLLTRAGDRRYALAWAGETGGRRVVALGLDLGVQNLLGADQIGVLSLFLRIIDWLAPENERTLTLRTGEPYLAATLPPLPREITAPDDSRFFLDPGASFVPTRVGPYLLRAGEAEVAIYANLFDPEESNIGRSGGAANRAAGSASIARAAHGPTLEWWMYLTAAAFVVAEWWAATRVPA